MKAAFGTDLTESQSQIYIEKMAEIEPQALVLSIERCIMQLKFFPKISEIIELAQPPADPAAAIKAWEQALQSNYDYHPDTSRGGGWSDLDPKGRFALHVIGGPDALFQNWNDAKQMGFLRRDFIAAYEQTAAGEKAFALPSETLSRLIEESKKQLKGKIQ